MYVYVYVVDRQARREGGRYIAVLRCDDAALDERELLEAMKLLQFLKSSYIASSHRRRCENVLLLCLSFDVGAMR